MLLCCNRQLACAYCHSATLMQSPSTSLSQSRFCGPCPLFNILIYSRTLRFRIRLCLCPSKRSTRLDASYLEREAEPAPESRIKNFKRRAKYKNGKLWPWAIHHLQNPVALNHSVDGFKRKMIADWSTDDGINRYSNASEQTLLYGLLDMALVHNSELIKLVLRAWYVVPKRLLPPTSLHCVTSQKIKGFNRLSEYYLPKFTMSHSVRPRY